MLLQAPASDWDSAFQRALEIGRGLERSYSNSDGEQVTWRLRETRTLDEIGGESHTAARSISQCSCCLGVTRRPLPRTCGRKKRFRRRAASKRCPGPVHD